MSTSASSRPGQGRSTGKAAEPRSGRPVRKASGSSQEDLVRAVPKAKVRRARLVLTRVDPWSVLKLAFLLSVALGILTVVAAVALYQSAGYAERGFWVDWEAETAAMKEGQDSA